MIFQPYRDLKASFKSYFAEYGGWGAFVLSPFTHSALLLTLLCIPIWTTASWPEFVLSFLPPILGFTLAGYALVFAFGDDSFRQLMAGKFAGPKDVIGYTQVSSTFLHFIVVQVLAIAIAILGKAHIASLAIDWFTGLFCNSKLVPIGAIFKNILAGAGFLLSSLAITNSLAAAFAINVVIQQYVKLYHNPDAATSSSDSQAGPPQTPLT